MADEDLVDGWTEPIDSTLENQDRVTGAISAVDGTGKTLDIVIVDRKGQAVTPSGTAAWRTAANGTVRFSPGPSDLQAVNAPYKVRWKVTTGGKDAFYPNSQRGDIWRVHR